MDDESQIGASLDNLLETMRELSERMDALKKEMEESEDEEDDAGAVAGGDEEDDAGAVAGGDEEDDAGAVAGGDEEDELDYQVVEVANE